MYLSYETIENLTEPQAQEMALDTAEVKGYTVYFIDGGEYRGFSSLVYKDGHHIHYVDDFSNLHPSIKSADDLKAKYIEVLNNKLFTEDEITEPLKSYDDYTKKSHFLHNYYHMSRDYISKFFIVTPESEKEFRKKTATMKYNPVGFCYMDDQDFINHHVELMIKLEALKQDVKNNYDYQKSAFKYEMFNHEYVINWQADYDVLSVFGTVDYNDSLNDMMDSLNFTEVQKKAYLDARSEVCKEMNA